MKNKNKKTTKSKIKSNNSNYNNSNNKKNHDDIIKLNYNNNNDILYKKDNPQYHKESTLYSFTTRNILERIENEFQPLEFYHPQTIGDHFALNLVLVLKKLSKIVFEGENINYAIVLESIASVPGLLGGLILHLRALRTMESSNWIKTLMDESENERIHLMVFIELAKITLFERILISVSQYIVFIVYFIGYIITPKTMHRIISYLEFEAVKTYTKFLNDIDSGKVKNIPASKLAIEYWGLPKDATLRDMILVIRQDEVDHNLVNHEISIKISKNNNDPVILENKFNKIMYNNNNNDNNNINNQNNNNNIDNDNKKIITKIKTKNKKKK